MPSPPAPPPVADSLEVFLHRFPLCARDFREEEEDDDGDDAEEGEGSGGEGDGTASRRSQFYLDSYVSTVVRCSPLPSLPPSFLDSFVRSSLNFARRPSVCAAAHEFSPA